MPPILCEDLEDLSLRKLLKQKEIKFQGIEVQLGDVINADKIKSCSLIQILELKIVGSELKRPDPYYERKLFICNYLKSDIQDDSKSGKFDEFVTSNEAEYEQIISSNCGAHLIEINDSDDTLWKNSSKSVEELRNYQDTSKSSKIEEDTFSHSL